MATLGDLEVLVEKYIRRAERRWKVGNWDDIDKKNLKAIKRLIEKEKFLKFEIQKTFAFWIGEGSLGVEMPDIFRRKLKELLEGYKP